jgi:RNA recognition motif-containing protein
VPSKLYVGNLAYSVSNDDLQELFAQVGQVQSAAVVTVRSLTEPSGAIEAARGRSEPQSCSRRLFCAMFRSKWRIKTEIPAQWTTNQNRT